MRYRQIALALFAQSFVLSITTLSLAWPGKQIFPGVTYEHRSGPQDYGSGDYPQEIYITYVDTSNPAVEFVASRPEDKAMTTSKFATKVGASVAINANFFNTSNYASCGMAMGQGKLWTDVYDSNCSSSVVFGPGNDISFVDTAGNAAGPVPAGAHDVITGLPIIVHEGKVVDQATIEAAVSHMKYANPRTAFCIADDKHTAILAVVDGRESGVRTGMRGITLARFMKSLGCYEAVNLDGGGSSTMYVEGEQAFPGRPDGVVNRTSDGHERVVSVNLGVLIDSNPPPQDAGTDATLDASDDASSPDASDDASQQEAGTGGAGGAATDSGMPDVYCDVPFIEASDDTGPLPNDDAGANWGSEDGEDDASGCACRVSTGSTGNSKHHGAWLTVSILAASWLRGRRTASAGAGD